MCCYCYTTAPNFNAAAAVAVVGAVTAVAAATGVVIDVTAAAVSAASTVGRVKVRRGTFPSFEQRAGEK